MAAPPATFDMIRASMARAKVGLVQVSFAGYGTHNALACLGALLRRVELPATPHGETFCAAKRGARDSQMACLPEDATCINFRADWTGHEICDWFSAVWAQHESKRMLLDVEEGVIIPDTIVLLLLARTASMGSVLLHQTAQAFAFMSFGELGAGRELSFYVRPQYPSRLNKNIHVGTPHIANLISPGDSPETWAMLVVQHADEDPPTLLALWATVSVPVGKKMALICSCSSCRGRFQD